MKTSESLWPQHRVLALATALMVVPLAALGDDKKASRDALFDDDAPATEQVAKANTGSGLRGYLQFELARTVSDPDHWSKMRLRSDLSQNGTFANGVKWKLGARIDGDAVYDTTSFYSSEVARNQRFNFSLRENYIDVNAGAWDFRLGRQHVVWGEMVGLFFADVVSARDLREFILPEFDSLRIPQWAARAEYFKDDFHAEVLWIPVASYDQIGKPGADFFPLQPVPPGAMALYRPEITPARNGQHMNGGLRLSTLQGGWDISGFYYNSMDAGATFYRQTLSPTLYVFTPRHERIRQWGGTLAKDFGSVVLKSEVVYTDGRRFALLRPDPVGVVKQNSLDVAVGLDFTLPAETRFNVQVFQRSFFDYDRDIIPDRRENGYSLYLNGKLGGQWEAQALYVSSLNRADWMFRPKVTWNVEKNWRVLFGADFFNGPALGLFGQYGNKDRVYSEIRYSF